MRKSWMLILLTSFLLLTGCSLEEAINSEPLDKLGKSTIQENIMGKSYSSIEQLLYDNFRLIDTISEGANETTKIYATNQFTLSELSSLLQNYSNPDQSSDLASGKQAFIYPNDILTLQIDKEDQDIVLMELATTEFVRNHYSPDYFDGLFALYILDEVLDVDDWGKKRKSSCLNGNCYGGYFNTKKYKSGGIGSFRGSTNRGGGPSAGK